MSGVTLLRHSRNILAALPPRPTSFAKTSEGPHNEAEAKQQINDNDNLTQTQYSHMVEMNIAQSTLEGTYHSNSVSPLKMVVTLLYS